MTRMLETCSRLIGLLLVSLALVVVANTEVSAQTMYKGRWIAEAFGNDKVVEGGTDESAYFSVYAVPHGNRCNAGQPRCAFASTPVTYTEQGNTKQFNPQGLLCSPLTGPRPAKGGTAQTTGGRPLPPLFRNPNNFSSLGAALTTSCYGNTTISGSYATKYVPAFDPLRGIVQAGHPVEGTGTLTETASGFQFPAAGTPPTPIKNQPGMFRTISGTWGNIPPYLYSYTYAELKNDAGDFCAGKGFFSQQAVPNTLSFKNYQGGGGGGKAVATVKVNRGSNSFGGVMRLLGTFNTKVCYFNATAGGCGLGYNTWQYQSIGAAGQKNALTPQGGPGPSSIVTRSYTKSNTFMYFQTALNTYSTYTIVGQRWPWTTGTVTVSATGRGPHDTYHRREGFDNRDGSGIGTVQLVSPILTQWLGATPNTQFETGGVAIMQIQFIPEPRVLLGLLSGLSLLAVLYRRQS
jgi:hypothetical protein